jgi:tetraspanin-13/31
VAFILIGVAVYGTSSAVVTNLPIVGGILACGVFLILISSLGLIGAIKHHQVVLFFVSFIYICMLDVLTALVTYSAIGVKSHNFGRRLNEYCTFGSAYVIA